MSHFPNDETRLRIDGERVLPPSGSHPETKKTAPIQGAVFPIRILFDLKQRLDSGEQFLFRNLPNLAQTNNPIFVDDISLWNP